MDAQVGFTRPEMHSLHLAGAASTPVLHVFVVHGSHDKWPADLDKDPAKSPRKSPGKGRAAAAKTPTVDGGAAPAREDAWNPIVALDAALKARREDVCKQFGGNGAVRVTAAEAIPGSGDAEGDVLVFPGMVRVKGGAKDAAAVERTAAAILAEGPSLASRAAPADRLSSPQVFVCAHAARDARCGHCGPVLATAFKSEFPVRMCSHIGGHKFAGNVIAFRASPQHPQGCVGDWLSYVAPKDIPGIAKALRAPAGSGPAAGFPPLALWRGRMGTSTEDHVAICERCAETGADIEDVVRSVSLKAAKGQAKPSPLSSSTARTEQARPRGSSVTDKPPARPRVIFVLGGPGAGKGTQCLNITRDFDFAHLSAGDLLREERAKPGSEDGALIEQYIKEGKIVPVAITVNLLLRAMEQSSHEYFLIDGFPRNQDNLEGWEEVVGDAADVLGVLFFDCPEKVMQDRLLERGKTSGRSDDNIESIMKRFRTYQEQTYPIIRHYEQQGKVWTIAADRSRDDVYAEVHNLIRDKILHLPRVLFVLGGPGAGKGTQCANITRDYDMVHLSAGDLLREERSNPNSVDGALIEKHIREGSIVPVEITVGLLLRAMRLSGRSNFLIGTSLALVVTWLARFRTAYICAAKHAPPHTCSLSFLHRRLPAKCGQPRRLAARRGKQGHCGRVPVP